jgi:hypothetical protein
MIPEPMVHSVIAIKPKTKASQPRHYFIFDVSTTSGKLAHFSKITS